MTGIIDPNLSFDENLARVMSALSVDQDTAREIVSAELEGDFSDVVIVPEDD